MESNEGVCDKYSTHLDAIDYSPDGGLIVSASNLTRRKWTGQLLWFDTVTKDTVLTDCKAAVQLESSAADVKWLGATRRAIAASDAGGIELYELSDEKDSLGSIVRALEHDDIVTSVSVNLHTTKFVSTGHDRTVMIWDVEEFLPISVYKAHYDIVWSAEFHASNPDILASCSQDGRVLVWDLRQSKPATVMGSEYLPSLPTCVSWQRDADDILGVGTETGDVVRQDHRVAVGHADLVSVHTRPVRRLAFAPHCRWLASCSNDCTAAVMSYSERPDGHSSAVIWRNETAHDFVQGVCWNPQSHQLASCSWDGTLLCHDVSDTTQAQNHSPTHDNNTDITLQ